MRIKVLGVDGAAPIAPDELRCYRRFASAVLAKAAKDFFARNPCHRESARAFFFSDGESYMVLRAYYSYVAAVRIRDKADTLARLKRWGRDRYYDTDNRLPTGISKDDLL